MKKTNIKEIKVGETYNVRMYVSHYSKGIITCSTVIGEDDIDGIQCGEEYDICHDEIAAFSPITPENGTKNTASAPKYDPCRFFKEGDIVSPKSWYDREPWGISNNITSHLNKCWKCTVIAGERHGIVTCQTNAGYIFKTAPCFLELITPVEELEPYKCGVGIDAQLIFINDELFAEFENEEDAKRVCALLNAEHRKEQQK